MIALEVLKKKKERNEKEQRLTRSFDRYPQNVTPDFRQLDTESLKRYIEVYKLDCHMNAPRVQLAGVVARHFRGELDASEEEILPNFVEYILNYNGGNSVKRIKQENKRQTRQRKRTENDDVRVKKKTVRKERSVGPSRAESKRSIVQDSSSQASQDVGEALGVEEDSSVRKATSSTTEKRGRKPGSTAKATKDSSSKKGKGTPRGRDGKGTSGRGAKRKNSSNSSLTAAAKAKKRRGSTASSNSRNKSSKAEKAKAKKNEDATDSQDEEISSQLEAGEQSQDTTLDDDDADSRSSGTRRYCVCKGLSYGEMIACDNDKCSIEWFHVGCVDVSPEKVGGLWFCPDCKLKQGKSSEAAAEKVHESTEQKSQDVNASKFMAENDGAGSWGKKADAPPYVEMIREAIAKLPQQRGTHAMICKQIESKFGHHLNWKPEPKTPVWKSSVRKILCQTDRFYKVDEERQMYAVVQKDAK